MRLPVLVAALLLAAPATAAAEPAASLPVGVTVSESAGTARIPVTLSEPAPGHVAVSWRTVRSMIQDAPLALAGEDYVEGSGTLEFAAGDTSQELAVTVLDDAVDDSSPYLAVELYDPQGATLGPQRSVTFAIDDDEPTPPASLSRRDGERGRAARRSCRVTRPAISLLGHAAYMWTPRPGTARAPQDFAATIGHGGIAYGGLGTVASVAIADDDRDEPDETFELDLAPDPGAVRPFSAPVRARGARRGGRGRLEAEVRADLERRRGAVHRVEVQPRRARVEQVAAQLRGVLDADPAHLVRPVGDRVQPLGELERHARCPTSPPSARAGARW